MTASPRYGFNLLAEGQASGEVTANEFLLFLEAVKNGKVISRSTNAQPGSPAQGDLYIIGPSPSGAVWTGNANKYGWYWNGWRIVVPQEGDVVRVVDEKAHFAYSAVESLWYPLSRLWSTSEYWTGEYGEGGTKVYSKVMSGTISNTSPINSFAHGVSPLLTKHIAIELSVQVLGLLVAAMGAFPDASVSTLGAWVDGSNLVIDTMGALFNNNPTFRARITYQKT